MRVTKVVRTVFGLVSLGYVLASKSSRYTRGLRDINGRPRSRSCRLFDIPGRCVNKEWQTKATVRYQTRMGRGRGEETRSNSPDE